MADTVAHRSDNAERLTGAELIRAQCKTLPNGPGVYRMYDVKGSLLYVGKAKSLKKRVTSYTKPQAQTARIQRMIALTRAMEFTATRSEVEALLLESNLIKRHRPTFNIVLRDDKSFPHIYLRLDHDYPMIGKHRGAKRKHVEYYGPFASATAVNDTLNALLRAFPLRNCSDSIFNNRSRPCLQYQIKRCSAPCVGRIGQADYAQLVQQVRGFLGGQTREIQDDLQRSMNEAAERLDFEKAALLRDRLKAIAHISSRQAINTDAVDDADLIAVAGEGGQYCVQVFFYRAGKNYGNRAYFPAHTKGAEPEEVLSAFVAQFYSDRPAPKDILLSHPTNDAELLAQALSLRLDRKVTVVVPQRGGKRDLVKAAESNALLALKRRLAEDASTRQLLDGVAERFDLKRVPERIEIYDNSHIQGSHAVGAFVVAGPEGFDRKSYRTFNIKELADSSDDFAMMREVLRRRFKRLHNEDADKSLGKWPDLILIDGGAGQLSSARQVLDEFEIDDVELVGIAKGPERDAGEERFFMTGREPFALSKNDPVLYYVQRLRDEVHRFVINAHRGKRAKGITTSVLDRIPGIGGKRKKALLQHFGSAKDVQGAALSDLERVPGIDKTIARKIYDYFHEQV